MKIKDTKHQQYQLVKEQTGSLFYTKTFIYFTASSPPWERQDPADVVGDAQAEEGDDHQQQDPPKAIILHNLLPGGPEDEHDALSALQGRV